MSLSQESLPERLVLISPDDILWGHDNTRSFHCAEDHPDLAYSLSTAVLGFWHFTPL